jgi:iron complex transport system substrate-binding protein
MSNNKAKFKRPFHPAIVIAGWSVCWAFILVSNNAFSYQVTDSFGKHWLEKPPKKIIVTDWALLQQLLTLGIEPIGAPELQRYQQYVGSPELPATISDIGLRRSPDLAAVRKLQADTIILGTGQKDLFRPFSLLTQRVLYFTSFSDRYNNYDKARQRLLELGVLVDKEDLAKEKLAAMDKRLIQLRQQVQQHFANQPPKVTLIRFSSSEKVLVYGANSLPLASINALGLNSALDTETTKWGYKEVYIEELSAIDTGLIFYIAPFTNDQPLTDSNLWQQLPAYVKANIYPMPPAWSHGGALSVLHTSELLTRLLLRCDPSISPTVCHPSR